MAKKGKFGYSEPRVVQSGMAPGTTKGLLPLTEQAGAFYYVKSLMFMVPPNLFGASSGLKISGSWKIHIKPSFDSDVVLFEQEVKWEALAVAIGDTFFGAALGASGGLVGVSVGAAIGGGINLATWIPLQNGDGIIKTTIINGSEIDPATGKDYLDLGQAEVGITTFNDYGAVTTGGVLMMASWMSPTYRMDIPVGAVLDRVFDHWQVGRLQPEALYSFAFKPGTPKISTLLDVPGAVRSAYPNTINLRLHHTYHGAASSIERYRIENASNPSVWKDKSNRLWLGCFDANHYKLFYSHDDGRTFKAKTYEDPLDRDEKGFPKVKEIEIWNKSYKHPNTVGTETDLVMSIAVRSSGIYFKTSLDNFISARKVAGTKGTGPYNLVQRTQAGQAQLVITNGVDHYLISNDGGVTWTEKL